MYMFRLFTRLFNYFHYTLIYKDLLYIQISIEAWKMFWVFHTWYEGLCRSAMKYRNNSCQREWAGHMACKQKVAWSHIKPKSQWNDHNYMLHTTRMTWIGNIVVMFNPIQMVQRKLDNFEEAIECSNLKATL
jgi:hypothetical protein